MKNHVFEKNEFESLEALEIRRTQGCYTREYKGKLLFSIQNTLFPFHTSHFRQVYRIRPAEEGEETEINNLRPFPIYRPLHFKWMFLFEIDLGWKKQ